MLRDLKNTEIRKNYRFRNNEKSEFHFIGQTTSTHYNTSNDQFQKLCPNLKIRSKDEFINLGPPIGESRQKEMLNEKIAELEKSSEVIDKLDLHYSFYLLKIL